MSKPFEYSVLKYRTSYLLDERVNVGLLFRFRNNDIDSKASSNRRTKYIFLFPNSLQRISSFFPHLVNVYEIKQYLRAFRQRANLLSKEGTNEEESLERIIQANFIINDANSFFFTETKYGFYDEVKKTTEYFKEQYFKHFSTAKKKKKDDSYVKELFDNSLDKLIASKDKKRYFKEHYTLEDESFKTDFEYSWQNGTRNLIKTLNFDLTNVGYIQNKAFQWKSEIDYWKEEAEKRDIRFDILLSKPTNKELFKPYDNAVEVLENIDSEKKIIEEDEIDDYAEDALEQAILF